MNSKSQTLLSIGALASLLAVAPAFAQTANPPAPPDTPAAPPADKPGKLGVPHRVAGEVVAADESGKTLTVKDAKGKQFTFSADADAAAHLSNLKPGDRVRVTYKRSQGQLIATRITERPATKAGPAR